MTTSPSPVRWHVLIRQAIRFNLVGMVNTAVDFGVFTILNSLGAPWPVAQGVSYGCGIATSYVGNKFWTFQARGIDAIELVKFVAVNITAMGISLLGLFILHTLLGLQVLVAKAGTTFVTMLFSFFVTRKVVFAKNSPVTEAKW